MSHIRNHVSKGPKPVKKQSCKTEQLQNIISLRINDQEKKQLEKLIKSTSKNISDIMREAIGMWSSQRRKLCLD